MTSRPPKASNLPTTVSEALVIMGQDHINRINRFVVQTLERKNEKLEKKNG